MIVDRGAGADLINAHNIGDFMHDTFTGSSVHELSMQDKLAMVNLSCNLHARKSSLRKISKQPKIVGMKPSDEKPFLPIGRRLRWHREDVEGLSQADYAASIGFKRGAYSLWEGGTHRLSLDGALAIRKKYGLSLDFLYEGMDDALPMTLRKAWRDRL